MQHWEVATASVSTHMFTGRSLYSEVLQGKKFAVLEKREPLLLLRSFSQEGIITLGQLLIWTSAFSLLSITGEGVMQSTEKREF